MTGQIENLFFNLKEVGLIQPNRKLRATERTPNFKADTIFKRTILYNPKFENISDSSIRFALLHEEGHLVNKQYTTLLLSIVFLMIFSSMGSAYFFTGFDLDAAYPIIYALLPIYLVLGLFSIRIFTQPIQSDEFNADRFAAEKLRAHYCCVKTGDVLATLLKEIDGGKQEATLINRLKRLLFGGMHPINDDRVNMVKKEVDGLDLS